MDNKPQKKEKKEEVGESQRKMMVTHNIRGVSEALKKTLRKYGVSMAMKPHLTLWQLLVHPKDKCSDHNSEG